jgi:hypothetical protein
MVSRQPLRILAISILSTLVLAVCGLLCQQRISMVDYEAVQYGFPYRWLEHVLVTFAGRADYFRVDTANLIRNIALYFVLSLSFCIGIFLVKQRRH